MCLCVSSCEQHTNLRRLRPSVAVQLRGAAEPESRAHLVQACNSSSMAARILSVVMNQYLQRESLSLCFGEGSILRRRVRGAQKRFSGDREFTAVNSAHFQHNGGGSTTELLQANCQGEMPDQPRHAENGHLSFGSSLRETFFPAVDQ